VATAQALTFDYTARDRSGATRTGRLDGPDKHAVAARLREMGYAPVSVTARSETVLKKDLEIPGFEKKVKLSELAVFSRQFSTMISSGLSLVRALAILSEQTQNKKLCEITREILSDIERGRALSDALSKHDAFPKLYVAMVRAGETAGMLDRVLERIATTLEKDVELRRKIKSAMTYPVVVLVMAVLLTTAMLIFIVPTFVGMFESLGGELPLPTKMLLAASNAVRGFWWLLMLLPIAAWQGFKYARKQPAVRYRIDQFKLKVPISGTCSTRSRCPGSPRTSGHSCARACRS